jgi:ubiquitin-protein ligase
MNDFNPSADPVFDGFLAQQSREGMELASESDLLVLHPAPQSPPHFIAEFRCRGLVREGEGAITECDSFHVGIWFPADYLRRADPFQMIRLFTPNVWHPNIGRQHPLICTGKIAPGTRLVDILYQIYDILTYQKYTPNEFDSLNKAACSWARANAQMFPIDRRPLKRRSLQLEVREI